MKGHAEMVALLIEADVSLEAKDTRNVSDWVVMVECTIRSSYNPLPRAAGKIQYEAEAK